MTATAIDEGPIRFPGPLVLKILADVKTETRQVVDPKLWPLIEEIEKVNGKLVWQCADFDLRCPYDHEQLWLRETWRLIQTEFLDVKYRADGQVVDVGSAAVEWLVNKPSARRHHRWRQSNHMPRWASRIDLRVEEIKLERVQDITEDGARSEGVEPIPVECVCGATGHHLGDKPSFRYGFEKIWDEINSKRGFGWVSNPPVWAVKFSRIRKGT